MRRSVFVLIAISLVSPSVSAGNLVISQDQGSSSPVVSMGTQHPLASASVVFQWVKPTFDLTNKNKTLAKGWAHPFFDAGTHSDSFSITQDFTVNASHHLTSTRIYTKSFFVWTEHIAFYADGVFTGSFSPGGLLAVVHIGSDFDPAEGDYLDLWQRTPGTVKQGVTLHSDKEHVNISDPVGSLIVNTQYSNVTVSNLTSLVFIWSTTSPSSDATLTMDTRWDSWSTLPISQAADKGNAQQCGGLASLVQSALGVCPSLAWLFGAIADRALALSNLVLSQSGGNAVGTVFLTVLAVPALLIGFASSVLAIIMTDPLHLWLLINALILIFGFLSVPRMEAHGLPLDGTNPWKKALMDPIVGFNVAVFKVLLLIIKGAKDLALAMWNIALNVFRFFAEMVP